MQAVNFRCGHCNSLMAVGVEYLGQQVRCPTCQQVVLAPAASAFPNLSPPAPVPEPAPDQGPEIEFKSLTASEDIFTQPSETEDALFASEGQAPKLDFSNHQEPFTAASPQPEPAAAAEPPAYHEPTPAMENGAGTPHLPFEPQQTDAYAPGPEASPPGDHVPAGADGSAGLPWMGNAAVADTPSAEAAAAVAETPAVRRPREASNRMSLFLPLVFIPLVLYAVLATAAAGYLYIQMKTEKPSLFEAIPDVDGDSKGVERKVLRFERKQILQPLPDKLKVKVGETLRIGDLEVTPTKVEKKVVSMSDGPREGLEPCNHPSLVLHLRLKNVSQEYVFAPMDNYFDRQWQSTDHPPLTVLEAGKEAFFGGPAYWHSLKLVRPPRNRERQALEGRRDPRKQRLMPGQELDTYTCTDGQDPAIPKYLFGEDETGNRVAAPYKGPLLWRVHLRRGTYEYNGKTYPATAVIGVTFTDGDYAG